MKDYRMLYSRTSRDQMRSIPPRTKSLVKGHIQRLKDNPYSGKALEKELSGYYSLRTKRVRIIYRVDHQNCIIQIHYVGHRKDVYELSRELLSSSPVDR